MVAIGSQPDFVPQSGCEPIASFGKELSPRAMLLGFFMDATMSVIERLSTELEKPENEVILFLSDAPKKYKVFTIPKRTSGHRVIAQPSKELKRYQRIFLEFQDLPIHKAAMAYRKGFSIKDNAILHKKNRYFLNLDLESFFNSITSDLFWNVWSSIIELPSKNDRVALEKLLFWCPSKRSGGRLVLSVGAPSSPLVSNFFMYKFDCVIHEWCLSNKIVYTRYADDLTFSTNQKKILFSVPDFIKNNLSSMFGDAIRINNKKTRFSSMAHNRHVTGVTINNAGEISLGRERKRYIKHLIHQYDLVKLDDDTLGHLRGLLSFAQHIEPLFVKSLAEKYSQDLLVRIIEG